MGFGFDGEVSVFRSSVVHVSRCTEPVQRQQSQCCSDSNADVPSQCTEDENYHCFISKTLAASGSNISSADCFHNDFLNEFLATDCSSVYSMRKSNLLFENTNHNLKTQTEDVRKPAKASQDEKNGEALGKEDEKAEESQTLGRKIEDIDEQDQAEKWERDAEDKEMRGTEGKEELVEEQEERHKWVEETEVDSGWEDGESMMEETEKWTTEEKEKMVEEEVEGRSADNSDHREHMDSKTAEGELNTYLTRDSLKSEGKEEKGERRMRTPARWKELTDMKKFKKGRRGKSHRAVPMLQDPKYKVRSAVNKTGDKGSGQTGQTNQSKGGNDVSRSGPGNQLNHGRARKMTGEDDDEDEENRKRPPSGSDEKRLDCEHPPKRAKGARKKKSSHSASTSPPQSAAHREGFANIPPGGGPNMRARGPQEDVAAARCDPTQNLSAPAPRGAPNQREPPRFVNDEVEVLKQMQQLSLHSAGKRPALGPAGDAKPSHHLLLTNHLLSCPLPAKRIPRTSHNLEAVKKLYKDEGVIAPHSSLRGYAGNGPREVPMGGAIEGMARPGDLQSPEDPQPMDINQDIDVPPGVSHGHPGILAAYANQLQGEKHLNFSELQGRHDGVLLDEELVPVNGQYREDNQYTKLRFLGKGSFGDVYLIQDKTSKKKVVAKRVIMENFAASEPVLCANLSHPNIVGCGGLVRTDDMVLLLFEYYGPCQTLQDLVDQNVLGQGRVLRIIVQLFYALVYLHGRCIVHKDIKPENILIYAGDRIRLIDFGLAMRMSTPQHKDDALKGTECYMAPEIAGSESYDMRADVWSAICTLICLISKHPPWAQRFKAIPRKIFIIVVKDAPVEDIPQGTDPRVREFIESVLIKDFQQRPTAAQALEILPYNIISELYNTPAISVDQEPEPEPMVHGIPDNFFPGPVTPQTPRGPHEEACSPFLPQNLNPQEDRSASDLLSSFYLTNEDGTGNNPSPETPATAEMESPPEGRRHDSDAKMEVDDTEEDMYGPTMDTEGPEVFNEGAFNQQDSRVVNGARPRDDGGDSAVNSAKPPNKAAACNFGQPVLGRQTSRIDPPVNGWPHAPRVSPLVSVDQAGPQVNVDQAHSQLLDQPPVVDSQVLGAVQAGADSLSNSQATRSFMQDEAEEFESPSSKSGQEKILGDPSVSASFELEDMLPNDKDSSEHTSWKTAFINMMDAGRFSSEDDGDQDETDYGGAPGRGNVTSGFDSNSPRDSAEEGKGRSLEPPAGKLERTSEMPAGIYVTVSVEGCEAIKVKIDLDYTVVQVAKLVVRLPNFENAQMMARPFSLRLEGEEEPLHPHHTFGCGEHFLVAMAAPDGGDWLWRIDKSGHVTSALGV